MDYNHLLELVGSVTTLFLASESPRFDRSEGFLHVFRFLFLSLAFLNFLLVIGTIFNYFVIHIHWI